MYGFYLIQLVINLYYIPNIESGESSHSWHYFFSLKWRLLFTVQCTMIKYTWKRIVEITLNFLWSDYGLGRSIHANCAQYRKTHFQYDHVYLDDGYSHIVDIVMSDSVLNICLPCGMKEFLYISNTRLAIKIDFLLCALQLWYWGFSNNAHATLIVMHACF